MATMRGIDRNTGRVGLTATGMAVLALGLAACGGPSSSTTTTTTRARTTTTTRVATTTSTTSAAGTPTTGPSTTGCASSALAVTVGSPNGSAGSVHYLITFRNTSSSSCTLYGYPGVSFLTAGGTLIGSPAQRQVGATPATVTLPAGGSAYSSVGVTDPGIPPCSSSATAAQVSIYPPGETHAVIVAAHSGTQVCSSPNTSAYQSAIVMPVSATAI
jgi:Protein of unknown function (DUF4232)